MAAPSRGPTIAAAALAAVAVAGCGLGPGPSSPGEATLTVTRDYGSHRLVAASEREPPASETVIRFLDREALISTRYGGGFVQSIDGIAGGERSGRRFDWFFYVNGVESPVGAADARVHGGDRIWWDYRDWTDAMRVPAVVGQWPEPFAQDSAGDRTLPVRVECAGERASCEGTAERLADAGVEASVSRLGAAPRSSSRTLRILVGPWSRVGDDPAAAQIEDGPATSGVFAEFEHDRRGDELVGLDVQGDEALRVERGGLVAAVRRGDDPPTWIVTGTGRAGVHAAVGLLDRSHLHDRYAVATGPGHGVALPVTRSARLLR